MITYSKVSAKCRGESIVKYLGENQPQAEKDVRVEDDPSTNHGNRINAYYSGRDSRGTWMPRMGARIADALGIDPNATPTDQGLKNLYEAKRADNGLAWAGNGKKREISAWDFTASPDKTVTLAGEFAQSPAERAAIWLAMHRAGERTMEMVAQAVGQARRGDGKTARVEEGEVAYISYRHHTARPTMAIQDGPEGATAFLEVPIAGDPQWHIHYMMFNAVATKDGHLGSLDTQRITRTASFLFGAYFQALLAEELRALGIEVAVDERHRAIRVVAIPDHVRDFFSKRHKDTEARAKAFVASQGREWAALPAEDKFKVLAQTNQIFRQAKWTGGNEREIWMEMAKELGWSHETVLSNHKYASKTDEERYEAAVVVAAGMVAEEFKTAAVIDEDTLRVHAAHGLIATGIRGEQDIERVVDLLYKRGIEVNGVRSFLRSRDMDGRVRVTNSAQVAIEKEVARHLKRMVAQEGGDLSRAAIDAAVARSGLDFTREPEHGAAQLAAIRALATSGRVAFLTGVAGAGKTAALTPLVAAWKEDGRRVIGTAIAWRQAAALKEAGVDEAVALSPLLKSLNDGTKTLDSDTVIVIDELSQVSPNQFVQLLRHQERMGFTLRMLGDRDQGQSIEAGDTIEILLRTLPVSHLPVLLSTLRQKRRRDREIAQLFRSSGRNLSVSETEQKAADTERAAQALAMKRQDGTIRLVGGSHDEVVEEIARVYLRRRDILAAAGSTRGISISAPSNADVADISRAIRAQLRQRGELPEGDRIFKAIDQRGERFDLPLVAGDRVRLFDKTNCFVAAPYGRKKRNLGANGDFVTVVEIRGDGLVLRNKGGREGLVPWSDLHDKNCPETRIRLGFGHVMTIEAAQGITSDEHINAMPRGTAGVSGFNAYVAESRHVHRCWTLVSEAAVREAELRSRALGDPTPVRMADLWDRMAADLGRHDYKALGMDLLMSQASLDAMRRRSAMASQVREASAASGEPLPEAFQRRQGDAELNQVPDEVWKDLTYKLKQTGHEIGRAMAAEERRQKRVKAQAAADARAKAQQQEHIRDLGRAPSL